MKKIVPIVTTVALSLGVIWVSQNQKLPLFQFNADDFKSHHKEQSIRGAIESIYSLRLNEETQTIEPEWVEAAIAKADAMKSVSKRLNKKLEWQSMGPDNVGGRIRAFLMHQSKPEIWFAGGVSGGLFRSTTSGQSWAVVNDQQENLNVTCIAQFPKSGKIIYGTGEGGFVNLQGTRNGSPAFYGSGVFLSSNDEGTDFSLMSIASDNRFWQCNGMVAHPTEDIIYLATESGLFSIDMTTATTKLERIAGGVYRDLIIDKEGTLWTSSSNGLIYKKTASSNTLVVKNQGKNSGGRTSLAVSPEDPNWVYALCATGQGALANLSRTTDGGETWQVLFTGNSSNDIFGSNRQGWYDNVVSVFPKDKTKVILGGVDLAQWDSINGYRQMASMFPASWNRQYVHADKHIITWNTRTNPATCIVGCDGGLYASKDLNIWQPMNRGFTTLQLYNVAANSLGHVVGGSQDNGTQLINFTGNSFNGKPSQNAFLIYGGDGFDVEFSKYDSRIIFMSTYYGRVVRTANSGQSNSTFWDERQKGDVQSDFCTHFNLWEKDSLNSRLYLAKNNQVWAAINPTDFTKNVTWFLISNNLGNDRIIEMDYTPDGDYLFIAKNGALWRVEGMNSATYTVEANPLSTDIPAGIVTKRLNIPAINGRTVTSVNVNPENPNHVVITLGAYGRNTYVFQSFDALAEEPTFNNITGDLPAMPVYDAVIDVDDPNRIIIGTDLGIWVTENGGLKWEEANDGMARVPVFELRAYEWRPWEGMVIYAGTHGRGYFKTENLLTNRKKLNASTKQHIVIAPNPVANHINASIESKNRGTAKCQVLNLNGQVLTESVVNTEIGNNSFKIDAEMLSRGYYFLKIQGADGQVYTSKFLKN
jgi:photosystem II stability/assembly factor-like uncharacterized protein